MFARARVNNKYYIAVLFFTFFFKAAKLKLRVLARCQKYELFSLQSRIT